MSPGRGALAAALAVCAFTAEPARAYVRSCSAEFEVCFEWPGREVPWVLNPARAGSPASCPPVQAGDGGFEDGVVAAARASFAEWENAGRDPAVAGSPPCTTLALPFGGPTPAIAIGRGTPDHLVVLRHGWCSEVPEAVADPCFPEGTCGSVFNCFDDGGDLDRNTLAVTLVQFDSRGRIVDADIEIADWSGFAAPIASRTEGWYYTCVEPQGTPMCTAYGEAGCFYQDLQNTLTHEVGHFLGLAHPPVNVPQYLDTTMYPNAPVGETKKRTLDPDDVAGVCAIYGTAPPDGGGCGCGSSGAGAAGLLLALAALAPRARRSARAMRRGGPPAERGRRCAPT